MNIKKQSRQIPTLLITIVCTLIINISTHAALIDADEIEVAYLLDENNGNVAKDISANGRHGEIIGAKWVKGMFGHALEYDGIDDNILVTGYNGVGGTDPRTTVFWFKSSETRDHSWIKWGLNVAGEKYFIRAHVREGGCNLRVEVSGGQNFGDANVCDGEWHHCAVVFPRDSKSVHDHKLYVDGELQTVEGTDQAMNTNAGQQVVNIGARITGHSFLYGLLDEVALFNVALSLNQIDAIRKNGLQSALGIDPQDKLTTRWAMIKNY